MLPLFISDISLECINKAAETYHLPAKLLIAVLNVEQGKSGKVHKNKNGSVDLGEMQINSCQWPTLYQYRITPQDVLYKPCVNLQVGAWMLAKSMAHGSNLLEGVGNYHSHTLVYNHAYVKKVRERYTDLQLGLH